MTLTIHGSTATISSIFIFTRNPLKRFSLEEALEEKNIDFIIGTKRERRIE